MQKQNMYQETYYNNYNNYDDYNNLNNINKSSKGLIFGVIVVILFCVIFGIYLFTFTSQQKTKLTQNTHSVLNEIQSRNLANKPKITYKMKMGPVHIHNFKYKNEIFVNNVYDGYVYVQPNEGHKNTKWIFEETEPLSNLFYISDVIHNTQIIGGENYDGRIYHKNSRDKNGIWKLITVPGKKDTFYMHDTKNNKFIVAGDANYNQLYHQPHKNRLNAMWVIKPAL